MDKDIDREPILKNGITWEPCHYPYDVHPDLIDQYELTLLFLFEKFDPEGHAENVMHPEFFGSLCNKCKLWTRTPLLKECPFCGRNLIPTPIND